MGRRPLTPIVMTLIGGKIVYRGDCPQVVRGVASYPCRAGVMRPNE
jgi:hypothetical protein